MGLPKSAKNPAITFWRLFTVVVHAGTLIALNVDQRSSDVASTRRSEGSIVPLWDGVLNITAVLLRDIGTEIENRPTSWLSGGLSGDGRQGE
jgi:hypothetical protein